MLSDLPCEVQYVPGSTDVILHVASAEHAPGIDIFESGDNFVRRLACRVHHDIEAAAMAHREHGVQRTAFTCAIQNRVEQRNQRGNAFERETFCAEIARL